jgi:hypothetical protein
MMTELERTEIFLFRKVQLYIGKSDQEIVPRMSKQKAEVKVDLGEAELP